MKPQQVFARLTDPFQRMGFGGGLYYLAVRALSRLSGDRIKMIRYHFVAQPVPADAGPVRTSERSPIRQIGVDDPLVAQFPRSGKVLARRFGNADECFAAQVGDRFAGYLWLAYAHYDEDTVRARYILDDPTRSAWDYDVYVDPDFRMGRTFSRLWSAANHHLAQKGVRWSFSRIDAANPASLDSHRQLGVQLLHSATFLLVGRWQLTLASIQPFIHVSGKPEDVPRFVLKPPAP